MGEKLTGVVTMEDINTLEVEIDDVTNHPKLLLFPKSGYPNLKQGDIVSIELERLGGEKNV